MSNILTVYCYIYLLICLSINNKSVSHSINENNSWMIVMWQWTAGWVLCMKVYEIKGYTYIYFLIVYYSWCDSSFCRFLVLRTWWTSLLSIAACISTRFWWVIRSTLSSSSSYFWDVINPGWCFICWLLLCKSFYSTDHGLWCLQHHFSLFRLFGFFKRNSLNVFGFD